MSAWPSLKLSELTTKVGSGATPRGGSEAYQSAGVPLIRSMNVHFDGVREEGMAFLDDSQARALDGVTVQTADVLLNITGASIGRVATAPAHLAGARVNQHVCIIRTSARLEPEFLRYFLSSPGQQRLILDEESGATRQALTKDKILNLEVPLPPLHEQRSIVAKLESLQQRSRRAREALDAVPALLEKLRQSILAAAFRGDLTKDWRAKQKNLEPASELLKRIRAERRKKWEETELAKLEAKGKPPTDDRWKAKYKEPEPLDTEGLPELPEGWAWASWEQLGFCQNGRAFPSAEYSSEGEKLLRPGNLHVSGEVEWTDDNTRRMPRSWASEYPDFLVGGNELVINLTAQSLKDEFLGRVCLTAEGERCLLNQRIGRLTPVMLPATYWLWFFKSPIFRQYVDTLNTGSLIQHMFTSQIDACMVPLAPAEEAALIAQRLEAWLSAMRGAAHTLESCFGDLAGLDRSVLACAFSGQLLPVSASERSTRPDSAAAEA